MQLDEATSHPRPRVVVGVDTHKDIHVARAKDGLGHLVGELSVPATSQGYRQLLAWAEGLGERLTFGIEGTSSYGAGLSRFLLGRGHGVIEVTGPNRKARRSNGKSDPADADAAASAVLSGEADGLPKHGSGPVEMIRALRVARSGAVKAHTQGINALKGLAVTAPEALRADLAGKSTRELVHVCSRFRVAECSSPHDANRLAIRSIARRLVVLEDEIALLNRELIRLTQAAAPKLMELPGVGAEVAGSLLVSVGDNPERMRSEAAFASLCGVSPVQASSGKTVRHRLNRGGDRRANQALWRTVVVRIRYGHEPTAAYVARRTAEGLSKREIIRCLKRYVAREFYAVLMADQSGQASNAA